MVDEIKVDQAPTAFDVREIIRQKIDKDTSSFEEKSKIIKAVTIGIDSSNSPAVAGREKYVWVREYPLGGNIIPVLNADKIPMVVNLPCLVLYDPRQPYQWQIWGTDWSAVLTLSDFSGENFGVGTHSLNQEWPDYAPGYDPLSVYPRSLIPLRTYPGTSGLLISVAGHRYAFNGEVITFDGILGIDLSMYQPPSATSLLVVVYLDKLSNTIKTVAGQIKVDGEILPEYPGLAGNSIISAAVRLDGDQTVVAEADITDLRMVLTDTEAQGIMESVAAVESEIDYTLSNHELRIDGLDSSLTSEIDSLDLEKRRQLSIVETELDYTLSNHELRIDSLDVDLDADWESDLDDLDLEKRRQLSIVETEVDNALTKRELRTSLDLELYALPLTMGLIKTLPALRGFWPGSSQRATPSSNFDLIDQSGNEKIFINNNNPRQGWDTPRSFPYLLFNGIDEWYSLVDNVHWDILGAESGVTTARQGLTVAAWVYFENAASVQEIILSKRQSTTNRSYMIDRTSTGEARFMVSGTGTDFISVSSSTSMAPNVWHFVVGRFDPSDEVAVWLDGVKAVNTSSIPSLIFNGTADLTMGSRHGGAAFVSGRIALAWICGAHVHDTTINRLWDISRKIFGV